MWRSSRGRPQASTGKSPTKFRASKQTAAQQRKRLALQANGRTASGAKTYHREIPQSDIRVITLKSALLAAAMLGKQKRVENRPWPMPTTFTGKWIGLHVGTEARSPKWITRYIDKAWNRKKAFAGVFRS